MKLFGHNLIFFGLFIHASIAENNFESRQKVKRLIEEYHMKFGASTSALQVEGFKETGETMWSRFTHEHPEKIFDHSTADITSDSYQNLERDINMLKFLGLQFYRFSISWSRILPSPINHKGVSQEGLNYYHNLIDQLRANNITPIVTLFHFDLPLSVSQFGGWTNANIIDYFEHFARIVFDNFGNKVDVWVTINEPDILCGKHYGTDLFPPVISESGVAVYLCLRNMFLAHARVYHLYKEKYNRKNGQMGMVLKVDWFELVTNSTEETVTDSTFYKLLLGTFIDPIFSEHGDYPEILKETVARKSQEQGFYTSRLQLFTQDEVNYVRNTSDFFGLNYYTPIKMNKNQSAMLNGLKPQFDFHVKSPSFYDDVNFYVAPLDPKWNMTEITIFADYPEGLKNVLLFIKNVYNNPKVFIIENGCGTVRDTLENYECIKYYKGHLNAVYEAVVEEHCYVQLYAFWTLMDGFEFEKGYMRRFGLFHTNFTDEKRSTTPKVTAYFVKEILNGLSTAANDSKG